MPRRTSPPSIDDNQVPALPSEAAMRAALQVAAGAQASTQDYQLIVPLSSHDTVTRCAQNLFAKRWRQSAFVQTDDEGHVVRCVRWHGKDNPTRGQYAPMSLGDPSPLMKGSDGKLGAMRVIVVGHRSPDFSDLDALHFRLRNVVSTIVATAGARRIVLDLVGCRLFDPGHSLADSRAGRIALWFMNRAERQAGQGVRQRIAVHARMYVTTVGSQGHKLYLVSTPNSPSERRSISLTKEQADSLGVLYKARLVWDDGRHGLRLSSGSLGEYRESLKVWSADTPEYGSPSRGVGAMVRSIVLDSLRALICGATPPSADTEYLDSRQALMSSAERHAVLANKWRHAVVRLAEGHVPRSSIHLPNLIEASEGGYSIGYLKRMGNGQLDSSLVTWLRTGDTVFSEMRETLKGLTTQLHKSVRTNNKGVWRVVDDGVPADQLTSMNAAFLIQVLLSWRSQENDTHHSDGIKLQAYSNLAALSLSTTNDVLHGLSIALALAKQSSALLDIISALGRAAGPIANHVADVIKVLLGVQQYQAAQDELTRNVALAGISSAVVATGMSGGQLLAGMAGESALEGFLGSLNVPVTGLMIGLNTLVESYSVLAERHVDALRVVSRLARDASEDQLGVMEHQGKVILPDNLAIKALDVQHRTATLGRVSFKGLTNVLSAEWFGWPHMVTMPRVDGAPVDLYACLLGGLDAVVTWHGAPAGHDVEVIRLPSMPHTTFGYSFVQAPGERWRSTDTDIVERLRQCFPDQFVRGMYVFPTDYAIADLRPTYTPTNVTVTLGVGAPVLVVPDFSDSVRRSRLRYTIELHDALAVLSMSAAPVDIVLQGQSGKPTQQIVIDATAQLRKVSDTDPSRTPGAVLNDVFSTVVFSKDAVSFAAQNVMLIDVSPMSIVVRCILSDLGGPDLMMSAMLLGTGRLTAGHNLLRYPSRTVLAQRFPAFVAELRRGGLGADFVAAELDLGTTFYQGYVDLTALESLLIDRAAQLDGTRALINGHPVVLPGRCTLADDPSHSGGFAVTGVLHEKTSYTAKVISDVFAVVHVHLSPTHADTLLARSLTWRAIVHEADVGYFASATASGLDSQDRLSVWETIDGNVTLKSLDWLDAGTLYFYTDQTLSVLHPRQSPEAVLPTIDLPFKVATLQGFQGGGKWTLKTAWQTLSQVRIDLQGVKEEVRIDLGEAFLPVGVRVMGTSLSLQSAAGWQLDCMSALGRANLPALDEVELSWGSKVGTVRQIILSHDVLVQESPSATARYVGLHAEGLIAFAEPPEATLDRTTTALWFMDGGAVEALCPLPEALAAKQPLLASDGLWLGESGLVYRVLIHTVVIVGMWHSEKATSHPLTGAYDGETELFPGSSVHAIPGAVLVHIRQTGSRNATVVRITQDGHGAATGVMQAGGGDLPSAFAVVYVKEVDATLIYGQQVRGAGSIWQSSVLLRGTVDTIRWNADVQCILVLFVKSKTIPDRHGYIAEGVLHAGQPHDGA